LTLDMVHNMVITILILRGRGWVKVYTGKGGLGIM